MFYSKGICLAAMMATTLGTAIARPDLNAFLNYKVSTTAQLVKEAATDRAVMDRFMRHFGMNREEVLAYLSSLHPGRLEQDGVFKIYSIPNGGYVKTHVGRIRKGTMMFFSSVGEPVLVALCGNPVTEGKPNTLVSVNPPPPEGVETLHQEAQQPPVPDTALDMAAPSDIILPNMPETGRDNLGVAPGISAFPLAGLLGLGAFGLISHGGGHHGKPPVPEPATMAVLALGLGTIIVKRRRK